MQARRMAGAHRIRRSTMSHRPRRHGAVCSCFTEKLSPEPIGLPDPHAPLTGSTNKFLMCASMTHCHPREKCRADLVAVVKRECVVGPPGPLQPTMGTILPSHGPVDPEQGR